jgi:AcrR family transcriptional regulator
MRRVPAPLAARLYAAAGPIADRGLDETKIEDIATATGVPKATLYYYFTGKDEILAFLLSEMLTLMEGEVAVAVAAPDSARERLAAVVRAQLIVMFDHPDICRALIGDLGRAGRVPEIADAIRNAFHQPVEQLLRDGQADGSLRFLDDPAGAATAVFGAVTMSGLAHLVQPDQADPHTVANAVLDALIAGVEAPPLEQTPRAARRQPRKRTPESR